nr:hypothetical protein Iba_chr04bCG10070 [Ipomoea batatas]
MRSTKAPALRAILLALNLCHGLQEKLSIWQHQQHTVQLYDPVNPKWMIIDIASSAAVEEAFLSLSNSIRKINPGTVKAVPSNSSYLRFMLRDQVPEYDPFIMEQLQPQSQHFAGLVDIGDALSKSID